MAFPFQIQSGREVFYSVSVSINERRCHCHPCVGTRRLVAAKMGRSVGESRLPRNSRISSSPDKYFLAERGADCRGGPINSLITLDTVGRDQIFLAARQKRLMAYGPSEKEIARCPELDPPRNRDLWPGPATPGTTYIRGRVLPCAPQSMKKVAALSPVSNCLRLDSGNMNHRRPNCS